MQLSGTVLRAIEQVLKDAEHKPADAALRSALRSSGLNPEQKRLISRSVFTYYRWLGWLDRTKPLRGQLEHAFDLADNLATIPDDELMTRALPAWVQNVMDLSPGLARELQSEPRLWLRARPGKADELASRLGDCELHATVPDALSYHGEQDLFRIAEFHNGEFEIQDLSSQIVGYFCSPAPGETWWDACAGEGGKTLHLCDLMQNKGLVWASDTAEWRLDILKRRASRAKLFNYRLKLWPTTDQLPTKTKFDGILVDAPCTGVGTWGRNPHARWTAKPFDVTELAAIQRRLLDKVAGSLKPGGRLIYSVCTLTNAETGDLVSAFQANHTSLEPAAFSPSWVSSDPSARLNLRPEEWHSAGMFVAGWKERA
jgi:16S rRNA (cytosine967-C5)-methyltransferase